MFHLYSVFLALSCWFLVLAGGLVTSTDSALAVPDWPLAYGKVFPPMIGGIFYEHGHRLIAATIGFLTIILVVLAFRSKQPRYLKVMSVAALCAVIAQGTLGGLTVLYLLPKPISISHACLGQSFFTLLVSIAFLSSAPALKLVSQGPALVTRAWTVGAWLLGVGLYLQLILAAMVRHFKAGLAIPTFPLAFGKLIPDLWNTHIVLHFSHRTYGIVLMLGGMAFAWALLRRVAEVPVLRLPLRIIYWALPLQVTLGALSIWTGKEASLTSMHVALGALVLAMSVQVVILTSLHQRQALRQGWQDVWQLGKPRISTFVVLTTWVGAYLAARSQPEGLSWWAIWGGCAATFLISFGACALNQILEVDLDKRMLRTRQRPLAAGRLALRTGWVVAVGATLMGSLLFISLGQHLALALGLITLLSYVLIYTPLKRVSSLNTLAGAVPGALPPMMGWAMVRGAIHEEAIFLFALLFLWQLPHFFAIAFMYKTDYADAGMEMLPVSEKGHHITALQMLWSCVALMALVTFPVMMGFAGHIFLWGSLVLGFIWTLMSWRFWKHPDLATARQVLLGSVLYLPAVLTLLSLDAPWN